jgi:hypothetical protein
VKRHVVESDTVPPAELLDYRQWCRGQGLAPYGVPGDPVSMRCAAAQWKDWEQLRTEWAAARDVDECDLGGTDSAPFDIDAI